MQKYTLRSPLRSAGFLIAFLKTLFPAAAALAAALSLAACDSKTATTGEARTTPNAEAMGKADSTKIDEAAPTSGTAAVAAEEANAKPGPDPSTIPAAKAGDAAAIYARPQVPILCYHQIRDWTARDSKSAKDYIVPIAAFKAQIKMLADSGYHAIQPDQLYAYLTTGATC